MQPLFGTLLERKLKPAFIRRSSNPVDTHGIVLFCSPIQPSRRARLRALLAQGLMVILLAGILAGAARASDRDHDRARRAVLAGQVLPLPQILERVARTHPGQVLEVELEPQGERWVYEMRVLQADGRLLRLEVDARNGELLRVKSRPAP
jgi:uncharacterized membrane protein YkoI